MLFVPCTLYRLQKRAWSYFLKWLSSLENKRRKTSQIDRLAGSSFNIRSHLSIGHMINRFSIWTPSNPYDNKEDESIILNEIQKVRAEQTPTPKNSPQTCHRTDYAQRFSKSHFAKVEKRTKFHWNQTENETKFQRKLIWYLNLKGQSRKQKVRKGKLVFYINLIKIILFPLKNLNQNQRDDLMIFCGCQSKN